MAFISTTLFLAALALSLYTALASVAARWGRIADVVASRGMPVERAIHLGAVRYTGRRLRLVSENAIAAPAPFRPLPSTHRAAA